MVRLDPVKVDIWTAGHGYRSFRVFGIPAPLVPALRSENCPTEKKRRFAAPQTRVLDKVSTKCNVPFTFRLRYMGGTWEVHVRLAKLDTAPAVTCSVNGERPVACIEISADGLINPRSCHESFCYNLFRAWKGRRRIWPDCTSCSSPDSWNASSASRTTRAQRAPAGERLVRISGRRPIEPRIRVDDLEFVPKLAPSAVPAPLAWDPTIHRGGADAPTITDKDRSKPGLA